MQQLLMVIATLDQCLGPVRKPLQKLIAICMLCQQECSTSTAIASASNDACPYIQLCKDVMLSMCRSAVLDFWSDVSAAVRAHLCTFQYSTSSIVQ